MFLNEQNFDTSYKIINYSNENIFTFSDFAYMSGNLILSRYFYNHNIENINNGMCHNKNIRPNNNLPIILYSPETSISQSINSPYQTNKKWNYTEYISTGLTNNSIFINDIDEVSGEYLYIYHKTPTYFMMFNNIYENFNFEDISYSNNHSIVYINNNNDIKYLLTNYKTNCVDNYNDEFYYGGLNKANELMIKNYTLNEYIRYHIDFVDGTWAVQPNIQLSSCNTNIFNYNYIINSINGYSIFYNTYKEKRNFFYNKSITLKKDSLLFLLGSSKEIEGFIELDYSFYVNSNYFLFDWIPRGYKVYDSGYCQDFIQYNMPNTNNSVVFYKNKTAQINNKYSIKENVSDYILFSSGYCVFPASSSIEHIQSVLSPLSPYGVYCTGNNLFDMIINVKGKLSAANLSQALNFQDFEYSGVKLDLRVRNNGIYVKTNTHGKINNSGDLEWQDNHGQELIKYTKYVNTGELNNLYQNPNHMGEIYAVEYNEEKNKAIFTGNLVNNFVTKIAEYKLMENIVDLYDSGGFVIGDYINYIPTGQFLSNAIYNSGIQSKFNKNSLQYMQTKTSNLTCREDLLIPSSLLSYTGINPNFDIGVIMVNPIFIYTTGVK